MFSSILKTHIKTITCFFLVFCLSLFTLNGCSNNKNEAIVQAEEHKMESSEYLYILTQQIFAAQSELMSSLQTMPQSSDMSQTISDGTIEDKPATDWIKEQSIKLSKTIIAARVEFDKLGLNLSEEVQNAINDNIEKSYETMEKTYSLSKLGITKEALHQYMEDSQKVRQIIEEYFGEGRSRAISNDKIDEYTKNHGLKYKMIAIDKPLAENDDSLSKVLKNEGVADVKALVDKYMGQIAAKKSIDDINAAYNKASERKEAALEYTFQYDDMEFAEKDLIADIKPNSPATLKEDEYGYYIIQRVDIDQESIEKQREMSKSVLMSKAAEELLNEIVDKYDIKENQEAIDSHDPIAQAKLISENLPKNNSQQQQQQQKQDQTEEEQQDEQKAD